MAVGTSPGRGCWAGAWLARDGAQDVTARGERRRSIDDSCEFRSGTILWYSKTIPGLQDWSWEAQQRPVERWSAEVREEKRRGVGARA